jgi:hypothetical protein
LTELTRASAPFLWAQVQENLALAYCTFYNRDLQAHHLDDALQAIDDALEVYRTANAAHIE